MYSSYVRSIVLILCAFVKYVHNLDYSDLEAMGIACPARDKCKGYRNDLNYTERSCECDSACAAYKDCCIDFHKKTSGHIEIPSHMKCMHYGENFHSGVYVVSRCSDSWDGEEEVKEKCEGSLDLSDPVTAAPVTCTSKSLTYKNLYCAECNDADMESLKMFQFKVVCEGLDNFSEEQIMDNLSYDEEQKAWGVNRENDEDNMDFVGCQIIFDVPSYLHKNVRFCRANVVSKCARDWTRPQVRKHCQAYMSVVYDNSRAYRNPHCAICNHKTTSEISCTSDILGRKKPLPFSALIDINRNDKNTPTCSANQIYDPYFKKCKQLACAFPGYVIQNGRCVPGG